MSGDPVSVLNAVAAAAVGNLWRASWQGGAVIALVWVLCRMGSHWSPRVRCWLWRVAYLKLLTTLVWTAPVELPVLPAEAVPRTGTRAVDGQEWVAVEGRGADRTTAPRGAALTSPLAIGERAPLARLAPSSMGRPLTWAMVTGILRRVLLDSRPWLVGLWLVGVLGSAGRVLRAWREAARLRRGGLTLEIAALVNGYQALGRRFGLRHPPELLLSEDVGSPVLVGGWRPAILMPRSLSATYQWPELEMVLAHELAHLQRRDLTWAWLPMLAGALFWFHPLVWLARREWRLAQEMACDEQALLTTGAPALAYGQMVLKLASERPAPPCSEPAAVGAAGSYHALRQRLVALPRVQPVSPRRCHLIGALVVVWGIALVVPWQVTAQEPSRAGARRVGARHPTGGARPFHIAPSRTTERVQVVELRHRGQAVARVTDQSASVIRRRPPWTALTLHQQRLMALEHAKRLEEQAHLRRLAEREHLQRLEQEAHRRRLAEKEYTRALQEQAEKQAHLQRLAEQEHARRLAEQLHRQRLAERARVEQLEVALQRARSTTEQSQPPERARLQVLEAQLREYQQLQQSRMKQMRLLERHRWQAANARLESEKTQRRLTQQLTEQRARERSFKLRLDMQQRQLREVARQQADLLRKLAALRAREEQIRDRLRQQRSRDSKPGE
jgi:beta-lactamase regulating signal transducer with metallopeptidase domain